STTDTGRSTGAEEAEQSGSTAEAAALEPVAGALSAAFQAPSVLFQPPDPDVVPARRPPAVPEDDQPDQDASDEEDSEDTEDEGGPRRRRRRGGRGRRGKGRTSGDDGDAGTETPSGGGQAGRDGTSEGSDDRDDSGKQARSGKTQAKSKDDKSKDDKGKDEPGSCGQADDTGGKRGRSDAKDEDAGESASSRRRRRRRRRGSGGDAEDSGTDDPPRTVVRVREGRDGDDVTSIKGSTRLEAKKQRRREGRDHGRRRPPIITEAEFLARREAVDRVMVVRQRGDRTQVAVLEDGVLVEHYVSTASTSTQVGNVYLGKVQNVLPSMEAAFVDIGRGRNGVLYAGEVNFGAAGLEGQPKRIESALKSGQSVLVQATKDPMGQKGSRLTSQVSLPGRYLVYVPEGSMTGISRKLPDTERSRLKSVLKKVVPEGAGVIVRTAAEGASEDELSRDVARLQAQWEDIVKKSGSANAPALLYGEPDLAIRVVRDVFNEDFTKLVVSGDDAWDTLESYLGWVAPDLAQRLSKWTDNADVFATYRVDEQIAKALDRKVWLPSGGSLVIDRTEAMTVVDVNTGKFTGKGGNLEETVTKNNLEAAEEVVRQLRLRDIGGIIVVDFIDMVLESNRDLMLRRLLECLGRDRTKHQVAEVTSLGLVQMTRKRVGQGLIEAFSEPCETCKGRGVVIHTDVVEPAPKSEKRGRRRKETGPASDPTEAAPDAPTSDAEAPVEAEPIEAEPIEAAVDEASSGEPVSDEATPAEDGTAGRGDGSRTSRGSGRRRARGATRRPSGPPPAQEPPEPSVHPRAEKEDPTEVTETLEPDVERVSTSPSV
ncbi:MAG: Rne/Rng family ribonuclease, partial [Actinomycetes bacterium]